MPLAPFPVPGGCPAPRPARRGNSSQPGCPVAPPHPRRGFPKNANHYQKEKWIGPADTGRGGTQQRGFPVPVKYLEVKELTSF